MRQKWFDRKFSVLEDNTQLETLISRLKLTPKRLIDLLKDVNSDILELKPQNKWSIKEEVGHLCDLEELWISRIDDFINREIELQTADLTNRKTHEANHNNSEIQLLLSKFQILRSSFLEKINQLDQNHFEITALHPRLKTPMKIIDHLFFVAEHDDHHIISIEDLISLNS